MTTRLQAIRKIYGDAAAGKELLEAFIAAQGDKDATAAALEVSRTALYRFIDELKLWPAIESAIAKHGFTPKGAGRPANGLKPRTRRAS